MSALKADRPTSLARPFQYAQADRPGGPLLPMESCDEVGAERQLCAPE